MDGFGQEQGLFLAIVVRWVEKHQAWFGYEGIVHHALQHDTRLGTQRPGMS